MRFPYRPAAPAALLAALTLAGVAAPAYAQDAAPPDTIRVERGTVIILDDDVVRTAPGEIFLRRGRVPGLREGRVLALPDEPFDRLGERMEGVARLMAEHEGDLVRLRSLAPDAGLLALTAGRTTPEIARMETEARHLARAAREAEGAERERLEQELRERLDELFEEKMAVRAEAVEALEAELAERRERYDERLRERDAIVDRRLRELLGERDVLDW